MRISFAQNQEDIMLWRALKHVENGFYIDVGAAEPVNLSVTHLFSLEGWSGINLEPEPSYFKELRESRQRDINLQLCVASQAGEIDFFRIAGTGLSTTSESIALEHEKAGFNVKKFSVRCKTLREICEDYVDDRQIHFLKIDVEGAELDVLAGADFNRFRPWIVVVEATLPMIQTENHLSWEHILTESKYEFAWFDGLNRFYVASERSNEILQHFRTPPNIFDGFTRAADLAITLQDAKAAVGAADKRNSELHKQLALVESKRMSAERKITSLMEKITQIKRQIDSMIDDVE